MMPAPSQAQSRTPGLPSLGPASKARHRCRPTRRPVSDGSPWEKNFHRAA